MISPHWSVINSVRDERAIHLGRPVPVTMPVHLGGDITLQG